MKPIMKATALYLMHIATYLILLVIGSMAIYANMRILFRLLPILYSYLVQRIRLITKWK